VQQPVDVSEDLVLGDRVAVGVAERGEGEVGDVVDAGMAAVAGLTDGSMPPPSPISKW
jgi:hypothetical protein